MASDNEGNTHSNNSLYAQELLLEVTEIVGNQILSLVIEVSDEGIVLRGTCGSYHTKQAAQGRWQEFES